MNPKPERIDAAFALVGGGIAVIEDELQYFDGQTPPSESAINTKLSELQAEYDAKQYQRDRQPEYPNIGEQLDMIYWDKKNGTKKWEEAIDKVKADHPKG